MTKGQTASFERMSPAYTEAHMLNLLKPDVSEPTSAPLTGSSFNYTHKAIVLIPALQLQSDTL